MRSSQPPRFEQVPVALLSLNRELGLCDANERARQWLGLQAGLPAEGVAWLEALEPDTRQALRGLVTGLAPGAGEKDAEIPWRRAGSPPRLLRAQARLVREPRSGSEVELALVDVTADRHRAQQAELRSRLDTLTGVANRAGLLEQLEQALATAQRQNRRLAVMFVDLDQFKAVNDTHGHQAGDQVLSAAAARLRGALRQGDMLGRMGGDEFVVLAPLEPATPATPLAQHADEAARVAQRLLAAMADPVALAERELPVGASVGVALFPEHGAERLTLLRHADQALYRAKHEGGRTACFFDPALDSDAHAQRQRQARLQQALDQGELKVQVRPVVCSASSRVLALQAEPCWQHPERGLLEAADFLADAQAPELAWALFAWVLRTAAGHLRRCSAPGWHGLRLVLDLPPRVALRDGLAPLLAQVLQAHQLPGARLELGLAAPLHATELRPLQAQAQELHALGVNVALGGWGRARWSLTDARTLGARTLALDPALVAALPKDAQARALLQASVALARPLRLRLRAEGLHPPLVATLLRLAGVDERLDDKAGVPLAQPRCA